MKKTSYIIVLVLFLNLLLCSSDNNRSVGEQFRIALADPFIMLYNNLYYAYGTGAAEGIEVYTSDDLKTWKKESTLALHKDNSWGDRWFWAPEVYYIKEKDKFFMYYSSDEHICVATSDSPFGPFIQQEKKPMIEDEKCIDNTLFIDDDGTPYMYFDRFDDGLNIWVAELEDDLMTIKEPTLTKCINVSQEWEKVLGRVNEGVFITKHKGIYYLTYSGNDFRSPFYGIGFATATSPKGPWTKYDKNPIFQNPEDLVGVGHSAMFRDKKGKLKIVFHAHRSKESVHPRDMYIADVDFTKEKMPIMKITGKILRPQLNK